MCDDVINESKRNGTAEKYFADTIPIFVLENIELPDVIPEEPLFVEVHSIPLRRNSNRMDS